KSHVTRARRKARQHLRNSRMSDRQDLNPHPRSKCPGNVEQNDPGGGRLQLARSGILVYIIECMPTRILPACTRSATRGSATCSASARLGNMAVNVPVRSSLFMRASKEFRCAPEANAARAIRAQDANV